jgi:protein subunit release factor A
MEIHERDRAFRPISKKELDEILALGEFLERLECENLKDNPIPIEFLNKVEKIITKYQELLNLVNDGKYSESFPEYKDDRSLLDKFSYLQKVHNQLNKLDPLKNREKELRRIANFLQKKEDHDGLKLEHILNEYHHKLSNAKKKLAIANFSQVIF